ncbi:MAG TPA: 16S rRNA (adenine(1518)-N(6)/adenine(1519)-N(6))-dimethyltransferase RsmA [Vicinamibacterales bacterium]|nr:16S rRNA (adenine(1518)-N(6)/adenine(1519)-N(6))-dimethyltransferase RsmA [Vicinamibacterales bacterium]
MAARKRFGQHFLEPAWVVKVIDAIRPEPGDEFVEIGPGRAALTTPLAATAKRVVAFEIDRDLAAALRSAAPANVTVVEGDFLQSDWLTTHPFPHPIRVAGNLPYNVASPILFKLIELYDHGVPMTDATLMLQREVVDRLVATPATKEYGVLTVLVRLSADVTRLLTLPPGAFRPAPKVQSGLVRLRFHPPSPSPANRAQFASMVTAIFTRRRKTIENALLAYIRADRPTIAATLERAGIDGRRRPETLDVPEFVRLSDALPRLTAASQRTS